MKPVCYQLYFESPLSVLPPICETSAAIVHSDTLYGAIYSVWGELFKTDVEKQILNPIFYLSSLFPFYVVSGKVVHFLPVPLGFTQPKDAHVSRNAIRFISSDLLIPLCRGQRLPIKDYSRFHSGLAVCQENIEPAANFFVLSPRKIRSSRKKSGRHAAFSEAELVFSQRAGLFFLAWFHDDSVMKDFEAALRLLADTGLGARRTLGRGAFKFAKERLFELPKGSGKKHLVLSLLYPSQEELAFLINHKKSGYSLVMRSSAPSEKNGAPIVNRCAMFAEGSLLHFERPTSLVGTVADVSVEGTNKNHKQYRVGRALCVPTDL